MGNASTPFALDTIYALINAQLKVHIDIVI